MQILIHTYKAFSIGEVAIFPAKVLMFGPNEQILENLEKGLAEDGSMITLTEENRQGKYMHIHRQLATALASIPDCITLWEESEVMGPVGNTDIESEAHLVQDCSTL